jgi:hypothetical protein
MQIIYAGESLEPLSGGKEAVFLAGPSPRSKDVSSWRPEAIRALETAGYDGFVLVPEPRDGAYPESYDDRVA